MMHDTEKLKWLQLYRSENVGPAVFFHLIKKYGSVTEALLALESITLKGGRQLKLCSPKKAEEEWKNLQEFGGRFITLHCPAYPTALKAINNPPPIISVLGNTELLQSDKHVAIVGSRKVSLAGTKLTKEFAHKLGQARYITVSGLARGVDSCVHEASLKTGTIAILGCGLNVCYPEENQELYNAIKENGLLISELPFNTAPSAHNFPMRNRLIAGICKGTLVVEAALKSGSLITAEYANEMGRYVMAIPGSPLDVRSRGGNHLIKEGAHLVETPEDALDILDERVIKYILHEDTYESYEPPKVFATVEQVHEAKQNILGLLSHTPVMVEELIHTSNLPPYIFHEALVELELTGRIVRSFGDKVSLCG